MRPSHASSLQPQAVGARFKCSQAVLPSSKLSSPVESLQLLWSCQLSCHWQSFPTLPSILSSGPGSPCGERLGKPAWSGTAARGLALFLQV